MQSEDQDYFDYHPALERRLDRLAATARTAPPHLAARIRETLAQESARRVRRRRVSFFAGGVTLAAATMALAVLGKPASGLLAPPLAREARIGLAKPGAIESADTAALVEWLKWEVGYQVDIPAISNAELVGATVAELGDVRGAAVVYEYRGASLTYFALPPGDVLGRPVPDGLTVAAANGYEVALWTERGAARAVAASMSRQAVLQVAEECRGKSR
jgi:anti-sigma factor RsiW